MKEPEQTRHLVVNRGHNWDISNGHDALIRSQEMWTSEDPHDRDMSS